MEQVRYTMGSGEPLKEISVVDEAHFVDFPHPTIREIRPVIFDFVRLTGLDPYTVTRQVLDSDHMMQSLVRPVNHETVLEQDTSRLHFLRLGGAALQRFNDRELMLFYIYKGLQMASIQAGKNVDILQFSSDYFGMFISRPEDTRTDIHIDGRNPTIVVNASEPGSENYTLIGPRVLRHNKNLTVRMLEQHPLTIRQYLPCGAGVVFNVRHNPHVGQTLTSSKVRAVIDFNYQADNANIDNSVEYAYEPV